MNRKSIYFITGVNCVGKSTLADALAAEFPRAAALHASKELREYFGNIDRSTQDQLDVAEHLAAIASHLTSLFEEYVAKYEYVFYDSQLVALKPGYERQFENTWSDTYTPYIAAGAMILAEPTTIKSWREEDARRTGRERIVDEAAISLHQQKNLSVWHELISKDALPQNSSTFYNIDGQFPLLKEKVRKRFGNLPLDAIMAHE